MTLYKMWNNIMLRGISPLIGCALCLLFVLAPPANGEMYSGSLPYQDGLSASGSWSGDQAQVDWKVGRDGDIWTYSYTFSMPEQGKDMSHALVEVVSGAQKGADVFNFSLSGGDYGGNVEVGLQKSTPGNPHPEDVYALKYDGVTGQENTFSFESTIAPTWGDIYAKGGRKSEAHNAGFTSSDTDPLTVPPGGNVNDHALTPATPEPGTTGLALLAAGAAAVVVYRTRNNSP